MATLGIDIGGSGIKGAPVDLETGELLSPRFRIPTPENAEPQPMAEVVRQIAEHFAWSGRIGCGFPAIMKHGVAFSAANIHSSWIGTDAAGLFTKTTGCPTVVVNDADAAGIAEMRFGAGRGHEKGVVLMVTVGTGIGSAVFLDGRLLPNTEFGHIEIRGKDAEWRASDAARQRKGLSWEKFARRLNEYLATMERLISPDLIIIGGGVSKEFGTIEPLLELKAKVLPAQLLNLAGIVGAALAAEEGFPGV